jgi:hypothetical protein
LSLLTIRHKGFQSHFIASIFLALAISNSLRCLTTKPNLCYLNKSFCLFSTSLNYCRCIWYSKNSCKELANDCVSLVSKKPIVWETIPVISFPCLDCIRPNSEKCINIHITYVRNIQKMNKNKWLTCYLTNFVETCLWHVLGYSWGDRNMTRSGYLWGDRNMPLPCFIIHGVVMF